MGVARSGKRWSAVAEGAGTTGLKCDSDAVPRNLTAMALRPLASATWRELIKRVWEVDPLLCLRCGSEMVRLAAIMIR